ncbi:hypothetical protein H5410_018030 [Solanum commersonii]|uniref:Uncharacterized protein n=1 Tax=Solanum commersonii TaxID=4109 RepID=A0A9J6A0S3_SOLCO|nr:hypothetical protein H5410_018030 [Solanum commersonii]
MSKKTVVTPRKIPRLVEGTSTDEVHAPSFNILTQIPLPNIVETPARVVYKWYELCFNSSVIVCLLTVYTKSENGAISESEVTGTIASKFGGPRIAKEHVPDTTNYPTPRPGTRNLK